MKLGPTNVQFSMHLNFSMHLKERDTNAQFSMPLNFSMHLKERVTNAFVEFSMLLTESLQPTAYSLQIVG